MNLHYTMILAILAISAAASAADTTDRASPLDNNAACMDRTVDATTGKCVVKDEGTPRRTYPQRPAAPIAAPAPAPTSPASTVRKSGTGK